jgi:hypothetical protein
MKKIRNITIDGLQLVVQLQTVIRLRGLQSETERDRARQTRDRPETERDSHRVSPKTPAFYGVLCSSHFLPFFGSCGFGGVNIGQHRPQERPT